jgi:hypothetical protein
VADCMAEARVWVIGVLWDDLFMVWVVWILQLMLEPLFLFRAPHLICFLCPTQRSAGNQVIIGLMAYAGMKPEAHGCLQKQKPITTPQGNREHVWKPLEDFTPNRGRLNFLIFDERHQLGKSALVCGREIYGLHIRYSDSVPCTE